MNNMYDLCLCVFFLDLDLLRWFLGRLCQILINCAMSTNKNKIAPKDIVIFSHYSWQNPLITTLI